MPYLFGSGSRPLKPRPVMRSATSTNRLSSHGCQVQNPEETTLTRAQSLRGATVDRFHQFVLTPPVAWIHSMWWLLEERRLGDRPTLPPGTSGAPHSAILTRPLTPRSPVEAQRALDPGVDLSTGTPLERRYVTRREKRLQLVDTHHTCLFHH